MHQNEPNAPNVSNDPNSRNETKSSVDKSNNANRIRHRTHMPCEPAADVFAVTEKISAIVQRGNMRSRWRAAY
jgi:hypothetical protein